MAASGSNLLWIAAAAYSDKTEASFS